MDKTSDYQEELRRLRALREAIEREFPIEENAAIIQIQQLTGEIMAKLAKLAILYDHLTPGRRRVLQISEFSKNLEYWRQSPNKKS